MKFLEFVSCCGTAGAASRPAIQPEEEISAAARLPEEDTRLLMRSSRSHSRRKRGRFGASPSSSSSVDWKPSLCSISEENVVTAENRDRRDHRPAGSERLAKRKSAPRSSRTSVGSYSDDYRRSSYPTVIPAFSPTPFMF